MKRFLSELKELKKLVKNPVGGGGSVEDTFHLGLGVVYNVLVEVTCSAEGTLPLGFGNFYETLDILTPEEFGEVYYVLEEVSGLGQRLWRVNDVFGDIFPPLGEGRILNELASCKNSGEGVMRSVKNTFPLVLGVVYNALVEVKRGVVQGLAVFRHAELDSASQFVILRCQRHSPIRCWYNFKASLRVAKNLKLAPSLALPHRRGNITISPLPLGEGRISMRVFTSIRNSGEGATHVAQPINIGDNFVNSGEGGMHVIKVYKGINERIKTMKQIIENLMKYTRHAELDSASQVNPLLSLRDTLPQGRGNTLCAKHTVTNLSTYHLNVLKTDNTPTLSRICKFAFSSLTNSTLSQRERVKCPAFTLAETLITLGIIGIVSAVTIPTLVSNYRKHETVVRLKRVYNVLNNAMILASKDYGEVENWDECSARDFILKYLQPYLPGSKFVSEGELTQKIVHAEGWDLQLNSGWASGLKLKTGELIRIPNGLIFSSEVNKNRIIFNFLIKENKSNEYYQGKDYFGFAYEIENSKFVWFDTIFSYSYTCKSNINTLIERCPLYGHESACMVMIACNGWVIPDYYPIKF